MTRLLGDTENPATHPSPPVRPAQQRGKARGRAAIWAWAAVALAIGVGVPLLWSRPAVPLALHQSFTRLPTTYTELYFTRPPAAGHGEAVVPISLVIHGSREAPARLRVWLSAAGGKATATTTVTLAAKPETQVTTVVRLPLEGRSVIVNVALLGNTQMLHFRLDHSAPSSSGGTL